MVADAKWIQDPISIILDHKYTSQIWNYHRDATVVSFGNGANGAMDNLEMDNYGYWITPHWTAFIEHRE